MKMKPWLKRNGVKSILQNLNLQSYDLWLTKSKYFSIIFHFCCCYFHLVILACSFFFYIYIKPNNSTLAVSFHPRDDKEFIRVKCVCTSKPQESSSITSQAYNMILVQFDHMCYLSKVVLHRCRAHFIRVLLI